MREHMCANHTAAHLPTQKEYRVRVRATYMRSCDRGSGFVESWCNRTGDAVCIVDGSFVSYSVVTRGCSLEGPHGARDTLA